MTLWFRLIAHLLLTLARLAGPGGVRAVAAESLAVKHQLLIMKRSRRRGPNLTGWDRLILGFCTLLVSPRRLGKIAVILLAPVSMNWLSTAIRSSGKWSAVASNLAVLN